MTEVHVPTSMKYKVWLTHSAKESVCCSLIE